MGPSHTNTNTSKEIEMEVEERFKITLRLTPREVRNITYCVSELLEITNSLDVKRGFSLSLQDECQSMLIDLNKLCEELGPSHTNTNTSQKFEMRLEI